MILSATRSCCDQLLLSQLRVSLLQQSRRKKLSINVLSITCRASTCKIGDAEPGDARIVNDNKSAAPTSATSPDRRTFTCSSRFIDRQARARPLPICRAHQSPRAVQHHIGRISFTHLKINCDVRRESLPNGPTRRQVHSQRHRGCKTGRHQYRLRRRRLIPRAKTTAQHHFYYQKQYCNGFAKTVNPASCGIELQPQPVEDQWPRKSCRRLGTARSHY